MRKLFVITIAVSIVLAGCGTEQTTIDVQETTQQTTESESSTEPNYYKGEITLNGIEWESNYNTVKSNLSTFSVSDLKSATDISGYELKQLLTQDFSDTTYGNNGINAYATVTYDNGVIDLYGHDSYGGILYFAYTKRGNSIPKTDSATAFYGAQFFYETDDFNATVEEMLPLIIDEYGEYNEVSGYDLSGNPCEYAVWMGGNGGYASLSLTQSDDSQESDIVLAFSYDRADDLLDEAYNTIAQENETDSEPENDYFYVGDTFTVGNIEITFDGFDSDFTDYNEYHAPNDGYKYVKADFTYRNAGETNTVYVSIYDFNCYADDENMEEAYLSDDSFINVNLSPNRTKSFSVYFSVPVGAESIELEYVQQKVFTSDEIYILKGE